MRRRKGTGGSSNKTLGGVLEVTYLVWLWMRVWIIPILAYSGLCGVFYFSIICCFCSSDYFPFGSGGCVGVVCCVCLGLGLGFVLLRYDSACYLVVAFGDTLDVYGSRWAKMYWSWCSRCFLAFGFLWRLVDV